MRTARTAPILATVVVAACAPTPDKGTLAQLRDVQAEIKEVQVEEGLDKAMESYKRYLEETPKTAMTPEAMRRLADLKVEKQFGLLGDGKLMELEASEDAAEAIKPQLSQAQPSKSTTPTLAKPEVRKIRSIEDSSAGAQAPKAAGIADLSESLKDFERRATAQNTVASEGDRFAVTTPGSAQEMSASGPLEAIALYDQLLAEYPTYEHNDKVLYQKSRAYDELGRTEEAMKTMERLIAEHPHSRYIDEVQYRRAEYFFTRKKYRDAEDAYSAVIALGEPLRLLRAGLVQARLGFVQAGVL